MGEVRYKIIVRYRLMIRHVKDGYSLLSNTKKIKTVLIIFCQKQVLLKNARHSLILFSFFFSDCLLRKVLRFFNFGPSQKYQQGSIFLPEITLKVGVLSIFRMHARHEVKTTCTKTHIVPKRHHLLQRSDVKHDFN